MAMPEAEAIPFEPLDLRGERLLVLAPHPDDEVIGCGGLVALHLREGRRVRVVVATDGGEAGEPAERQRESRAALASLGNAEIEFLNLPDRHLAESEYLVGKQYTIADMAVWPWYGALAKGLVYGAGEFLSVHEYKNVQRWTDAIAKRPAVKRGRMVNRISGDPASQLHERHEASDFDTRTQDKIGEPAKM